MDTIAISDLRANLPRLIDEVSEKLKSFIVTVSGKPKAVVLSVEELESLQETSEILAIPGALDSIQRSLVQIKRGQSITLEELQKKYMTPVSHAKRNTLKKSRK